MTIVHNHYHGVEGDKSSGSRFGGIGRAVGTVATLAVLGVGGFMAYNVVQGSGAMDPGSTPAITTTIPDRPPELGGGPITITTSPQATPSAPVAINAASISGVDEVLNKTRQPTFASAKNALTKLQQGESDPKTNTTVAKDLAGYASGLSNAADAVDTAVAGSPNAPNAANLSTAAANLRQARDKVMFAAQKFSEAATDQTADPTALAGQINTNLTAAETSLETAQSFLAPR